MTASLIEVTPQLRLSASCPLALPSVPVTVGGALLLALGLGFAWAAPLQRALAAMLDITRHFRFTVFYALFALGFTCGVHVVSHHCARRRACAFWPGCLCRRGCWAFA